MPTIGSLVNVGPASKSLCEGASRVAREKAVAFSRKSGSQRLPDIVILRSFSGLE